MNHFEIKHNFLTEEWEIIYDEKLLLATYTTQEIYNMFDLMFRTLDEETMLKILFAFEMYRRMEHRDIDTIAQRYLLTKLFNGVIL